jgi:phage-related protein
MGDGLWEVRSDLPGDRIARVLFSIAQGKILILHGFIKKSQKTPDADLGAGPENESANSTTEVPT